MIIIWAHKVILGSDQRLRNNAMHALQDGGASEASNKSLASDI